MNTFSAKAYSKWILAGEHSVLRGHQALVFPLKPFSIKLNYLKNNKPLEFFVEGTYGEELQLFFAKTFRHACELLKEFNKELTEYKISGTIVVENGIPLGAGMGSSAALSVVISKLFIHLGFLQEESLFLFAKTLEDVFHGESSGVDLVASINPFGVIFRRPNSIQKIEPTWSPKLYLSYSGDKGVTSECVNKVNYLKKKNPSLADNLDERMNLAVEKSLTSLRSRDEGFRFEELKSSIELANDCFLQWGLVTGKMLSYYDRLYTFGATAVKPTGSGGGGYILSLWSQPPPKELLDKMIAIDF